MRLATVLLNDIATPGLLARNHRSVYPLRGFDDTLDFLTAGPDAWDIDPEELNDPSRYENFQRILAPIANPPKLICIGLNYRDHSGRLHQILELHHRSGRHGRPAQGLHPTRL